jgi:hypothetical protein
MRSRPQSIFCQSRFLAFAVLVAFFVVQVWTIDYGTTINNIPWVKSHETALPPPGTALDKDAVVERDETRPEDADRWALRFKLYSVEADEVVPIMALARMSPAEGRFNPGFYQYGGAFLYSLGGWYFTLSKLNIISLAPLPGLLREPDSMDAVYKWGRIFVLLSFTIAGWLLFETLRQFASQGGAILGLIIFLFCPASIQFSQILKPHWFSLLWINAALLLLTTAIVRRRLTLGAEIGLGAALGCAVGTVSLASVFCILIWFALIWLVRRGFAGYRSLVLVPAITGVLWLLTNPFVVLDTATVAIERSMLADWYGPRFAPGPVIDFVVRSMLPGFGISFTLLLLLVAAAELLRPSFSSARLLTLAVLLPVIPIACLMASMIHWNVSYRYTPYLLPLALILLAASKRSSSLVIMSVVTVLTLAQALPLKLAYLDENDPQRSTRLQAARWIEQSMPAGTPICLGSATPTPYDTPPFDLTRYPINRNDCGYIVQVEREMDLAAVPHKFELVQRFRPRLSPSEPQLVFGHINPQISIYRRVTVAG